MKTKIIFLLILLNSTLAVQGCTTAVVAGAGAAGGYIANEKGYKIRNPITKKSDKKEK
ncbi:MAG: hypothetical protein ACRBCI_07265 [Cellvibrionaceae bacterium]